MLAVARPTDKKINVYYAGYYLIAVITEPSLAAVAIPGGGGALGYFLGGYVPPGTPNWHPVLKKIPLEIGQFFIPRSRIRPKTDTPF